MAPFLGSGIQTRLFYAEVPFETHTEYEVWEWIAAQGKDLFVRREAESTPRQVIAEQFFPVTKFWEKHQRLPLTDSELKKTLEEHQDDMEARMKTSPWKPYRGSP